MQPRSWPMHRDLTCSFHASAEYGWNLDFGRIAAIFRAGCIIQAEFLNDITRAFEKNPKLNNLILDEFFLDKIKQKPG